jgi:NAD(P)-dependent dehydrogenase (short-subunit alcohol dehydrogenase family)
MAKKLQGQVAVITGGGRGIGAAAAQRLATAGANVVLTARSEEQIQTVADQIRTAGGRAIAVAADVSDLEQVEEVMESALDQFNRVDIVINNAGVIWPMEEIADVDPEEWAYAIHVNLVGAFYVAHNALPLMLDQGYGRILNITSGAAHSPIVGASAYCASKAGLDMLTQTLAKEVEGTGVTINGLSPGMVDTEMQADIRSVDTEESRLDFTYWHETHEKGALIPPAEIADLIYWLVGPWSRQHTGQIFRHSAQWVAQVRREIDE